MSTTTTQQIALRARRTTPRWWALTGVSAAALVVLYAVLPLLGVRYPPASVALEALYAPADTVLDVIDVTTVLVVVAALTVVAVVRKLPYGIGAILMLCLGSTLTAAAGSAWLSDHIATSALPDGRVVAASSVIASGALVVPGRLRPVVLGLGSALVAGVALAAVVTVGATGIGIVGALLVTGMWWGAAGVVMAHSPVAAAREAKNPLDTAALMLRRR
ncbi:hypothetical protein HQ305_17630 [Rhodococcus sp. BP-149]|uniref:hypothetical protein n=1 Tax=unclassified Rhodococcus (in: high G+C Gram-positive bacteria) TaxID=192944 RepID=UPI001C9B8B01|nr:MULTISPECIES: hypothetical protein [unclassified Rhodococcus (in: high G+C Gram-positive bacteria)]MBY6687382.1 hypothetical protein [Rhodococcus sp. BP-288]MBY6694195.1 hypothetical protein [Rhodococcus sp. BP-188]MBY6697904.1 hypothetical protein [Rhodococcus sp. BP-285]MBY6704124.1 hypothetical protein [Rhodococcus sp. BP-283]MBY6712773.1 hypothetical protein [Rhodococcus sp. BP-160]